MSRPHLTWWGRRSAFRSPLPSSGVYPRLQDTAGSADGGLVRRLTSANMAELDYAFVADYATISDGKLSVIGGSFVELTVPGFPSIQSVAVVGRLRDKEDFEPFTFTIEFRLPGDGSDIVLTGTISSENVDHVYDGKSAVLFCADQVLSFDSPGLVEVNLSVDGGHVRTLKFDVAAR